MRPGRPLQQRIHHRPSHFHRMQHAPEQRPFDGVGMQADFVAIEFSRFEQSLHVGQRILGIDARLDGKQRGLAGIFRDDGFGGSDGEGTE